VPWNNLPKLKQLAPDYYDSLASYRSWTAVLLKFIFDPSMTTYSRVVRAGQDRARRRPRPDPDPAAAAGRPLHGKRAADAASLDAPAPTGA
jgi:sphingolipid delta-4 desaturase